MPFTRFHTCFAETKLELVKKEIVCLNFKLNLINVFWPRFKFSYLFEVFCKSLFASVLQFFIDYMPYFATSSGILFDGSTY